MPKKNTNTESKKELAPIEEPKLVEEPKSTKGKSKKESAPVESNEDVNNDYENEFDKTKEEWAKIIIEENAVITRKEELEAQKKVQLKKLDELQKKINNINDTNAIESKTPTKMNNSIFEPKYSDSDSDSDSSDSDSEDKPPLIPKKSQVVSNKKVLKLSKPISDSDDSDSD